MALGLVDAVDAEDAARALLLWTNSPSNPTGGLADPDEAAAWGRARGVPVFSDECYAEFTWDGPAADRCSRHGPDGVVAVHSLSKRSNLAGLRAGFYAGDPELVGYLVEVRRHAGLMVPGPVQDAGAVAFADDAHVDEQRARYDERLRFVAATLSDAGCPVELPDGGFYLWVPVPEAFDDGWGLAGMLARRGGLLVSPGEFYGPAGAGFVRDRRRAAHGSAGSRWPNGSRPRRAERRVDAVARLRAPLDPRPGASDAIDLQDGAAWACEPWLTCQRLSVCCGVSSVAVHRISRAR